MKIDLLKQRAIFEMDFYIEDVNLTMSTNVYIYYGVHEDEQGNSNVKVSDVQIKQLSGSAAQSIIAMLLVNIERIEKSIESGLIALEKELEQWLGKDLDYYEFSPSMKLLFDENKRLARDTEQ